MINYQWTISALDCKVKEEDLNDVVYTVHWRYRGTNENGITAETYGAQSVGTPDPDDFTPYDEITKEQVVSWLEASMDVDAMDVNLANQINLIINPVDVTLPLPWNTPPTGSIVETPTTGSIVETPTTGSTSPKN